MSVGAEASAGGRFVYPHLAPVEGAPPCTVPAAGSLVVRALDAVEDASPAQAVAAVTRELGAALQAVSVSFLIADLSGRALLRLGHSHPGGEASGRAVHGDGADWLPFDGGPVEQILSRQEAQVLRSDEEGRELWTVLAPVTERGDALGLLEMVLPHPPDSAALVEVERAAHLLAFVVVANRRHTDVFEVGQRGDGFTLAAEIQRRLLPSSFTCEGQEFTLAAWLEPAADVGGDTFDYSFDDASLHLSMTDAMGHGVPSALTATLCVGALRNVRRKGGSLLDQAAAANVALLEQQRLTGVEGFATGLLGTLDLGSGVVALVNAGHVAPYLIRSGALLDLGLPVSIPFGMVEEATYEVANVQLEPGDRLVLATDGMAERASGDLDLGGEVLAAEGLHPREATRRISDKVLALSGGTLKDDATLLVLDWHGPGTRRSASYGAG